MKSSEIQQIFNRLEPCPFCGKKEDEQGVQTLFFGQYPGKSSHYQIHCTTCNATLVDDRPDKVQTNWNTRDGIHPIDKEK